MARKLTKFEKYGLIGATVTGMIYWYLQNLYDPQTESLKNAREALERVTRDFNQATTSESSFVLNKRVEKRKEELAELEQEMDALDVSFGEQSTLIDVQHKIYRLMEQHQLRILEVIPLGKKRDKLFSWHVFRITLEGDFGGFVDLFRSLREFSSPVRVSQVVVSGDVKAWPLHFAMEVWM